ncbi:hypothetical protein [Nocardioides pantholopis]|uniref:hypothetical protein n=1 Tax=Nocardioides pantholopis TaxID=2483798 RepID=UPI0019CFFD61|nr:hypothetical protein [Nocardioides pantholopis]
MLVSDLLWALLGGSGIALLGTWALPGHGDDAPLWLTVLCGIGGVVLGNLAYVSIFEPTTPGPDWWRHAWQVAGAVALVAAADLALVRRRRRSSAPPAGPEESRR